MLLLALLLIGVAVAYLASAFSMQRTHADMRVREIELYGYTAPAVAPSAAKPMTARALAQAIGDLVGRRFGTEGDSRVRREILAAGLYKLTPRALVGYQVLAASLGLVYGIFFDVIPNLSGPFFDSLILAVVGWLIPITYVRRTGRLRLDRIERALPDVIDLVVVSVESGQGFAQAMSTAADRTPGPLGEELRLTLQEQRFGLPMDKALENLNARADTPNMRSFVRGVVQGERLGVSIGQIMRNIAREMRLRRRAAAEERAQKTSVKILFPLVFLILPSLFIVLLVPALLGLGDSVG
ncbi:type II secretion system F family protein [Paraconexibacter antarcticus]|uniref:Type II secretion system F family protein n=1 Tax=Paraconexibacter antarcticus TaxID=2949664 RepID=A0ABY5DX58_9ACTN|nr:type II secretion system F family protein [Paraconexibacter antarcticus]UTI65893.1 type II secretion system F family protein [Paraconexibacter antarcticus]